MFNNILFNTDSYKVSHYLQYPQGTEFISSYIESRGGAYEDSLFFGLQAYLMEYLEGAQVTQEKISLAKEMYEAHGVPFYEEGWTHILKEHAGRLPVEISAVSEGTILPVKNALLQIVNTDPKCYWLTSYLETSLLRAIWYPTTVATVSMRAKRVIKSYLEKTCETPEEELPFKLHDFGYRGVSSLESGALGGMAHLVNFLGTDTVGALIAARRYYNEPMAAFSIPAAEHSTITSWGKDHEVDAFANMVDQFGGEGKTLAVVSDSYDIHHAVKQFWGKDLKEKVINSGAKVVVRPDSGDPVTETLKVVQSLIESFGTSVNSKGYKVLHPSIRIIQGDGVDENSIQEILENFEKHGISAENIGFGMGGALLQRLDRDTMKFAMKCSAARVNGEWRDVFKDPITDHGKVSRKGELALVCENGKFQTLRKSELQGRENLLVPVFRNGEILKTETFQTIRERAALSL